MVNAGFRRLAYFLLNHIPYIYSFGCRIAKDIATELTMTVHAIKSKLPSKAEQALMVEKGHLWLHCFRTCKSCKSISKNLTQYEFGDGSSLILDSSADFPAPVAPELVIPKLRYSGMTSH